MDIHKIQIKIQIMKNMHMSAINAHNVKNAKINQLVLMENSNVDIVKTYVKIVQKHKKK